MNDADVLIQAGPRLY